MASSSNIWIPLNDGNKIPILGFGTYAPEYIPKALSEDATKIAIDVGFRHIDGAHLYGNEEEVGRAIQEKIKDGTVKREELFYTGKLWSSFHVPELIMPHVKQSLKTLQLDYMDLYIIHWPISCKAGGDLLPMDENGKIIFDKTTDLCAVWEALEECKDAGLVKSIGVSNFNRKQLEMILSKPGLKYKPVCNQVECHPYLNQSKLLEYCKSKDIVLAGYSVLGSHRHTAWVDQNALVLLDDPLLSTVAKKYNKSPAQVVLRYQIQRGVVAITKSYNPDRIKENFQIFDFELTSEDMKAIDGLNRNLRYLMIEMSAVIHAAAQMASGDSIRIPMNDGNKIPILGFGTYAPEYISKALSEDATKIAIDVGFRHIDGAHLYGNEEEVGRAIQEKIKDGTVKREELFYTGKLWNSFHVPELIMPHIKQSLKTLQLDYMDLYLIHWPVSVKAGGDLLPMDENNKIIFDTKADLCAVWEALEECKDAGLVKPIGVSNFNRRQIEMILSKPGLKYKPVCNQVECHPYLNQSKLLEYCKSKDIVLAGYSALGSHRHTTWVDQNSLVLLDDPLLSTIAKKYNKSPAQVVLRYQIQRGVVAITKSYNRDRIKENFQIFDFELAPEDMKAIDGLNKNLRYVFIEMFAEHPQFPFNDEY
ncbi:uncharacterized protein O3C94_008349 [Discoglossus pictus]